MKIYNAISLNLIYFLKQHRMFYIHSNDSCDMSLKSRYDKVEHATYQNMHVFLLGLLLQRWRQTKPFRRLPQTTPPSYSNTRKETRHMRYTLRPPCRSILLWPSRGTNPPNGSAISTTAGQWWSTKTPSNRWYSTKGVEF